jgi:leader peptidase (prepilin peptidase)/N-methyltransferase
MTCEERAEALSTYVDGELDESATRDLRTHLRKCRGCREQLEALNALKRRLKQWDVEVEPNEGFPKEILEKARKVPGAPEARPTKTWLTIAAVVLLALTLAAAYRLSPRFAAHVREMRWMLAGVSPWFLVAVTFAFGAIIGSFVNAAVYRLPRNISMLTRERSFCPRCDASLAWYDNIPILSFLALRGRCRKCGDRIPVRYLHVEIIVAALFALAACQFFILNHGLSAYAATRMPWTLFVVQLFLCADLVCIAFADLETWYIPAQTTFPWILLGLILAPFVPELHASRTLWLPETGGNNAASWNALIDAFQGLILGAGLLWVIGFLCVVLLGKEGMGEGDGHLVGVIGALLGWKAALATIFIGVFIGSFLGVGTILWDRFQQKHKGADWRPRQAAFELPDDPGPTGPPPLWPLLAMGAIVVCFETILLATSPRTGPSDWGTFAPYSAFPGLMIGMMLILGYLVRKRMTATGSWPQGEIQVREDGKKEEVLKGNYVPFGPSLALAGLIVAFYDPLIRSLAWWWFFGVWEMPAIRMLFTG